VPLTDEGLERRQTALEDAAAGYLADAVIDTLDRVVRKQGCPCGFTRFSSTLREIAVIFEIRGLIL